MPFTERVPYLDLGVEGFSIRGPEVMQAREDHWYARTNLGVAILRYDDVNALMKDKRLRQGSARWPSHYGINDGLLAEWWPHMLLSVEGEDHNRIRRLANPAFSPRILEALTPEFTALANELIDAFSESGSCEFMADFAEPYAARVITRLLGMPEEQWEPLARLSTEFGYAFSVTIKEDLEMITHGLQGVLDMSQELIDRKRDAQDDDFISALVAASVDGEKITEHELLVMVSFLILAGFDTTRNQLGLAMQTFAAHPEQWELLANEPELARNAVEEVMRVNPTITWVSREAIDDFEYKDLSVPAGTTIHLFSIPAGSDPRKYANFEFDITAERAPHFGFGGGVHHCLGHFVARIDMREALKTLAHRLPEMRIAPGATYLPDSGNTGPTHLPLAFRATAR